MNQTATSIQGVTVGHAEDRRMLSGCTVVLFERPSVTACDPRGGWPGGFDTHSVDAAKTFYRKQAIFLTGGDIFGFDAAAGVRRLLLERGLAGTGIGRVPGIVGSNIYDIGFARDVTSIDYEGLGYAASSGASSSPVPQGNFGAGIGATVGKFLSQDLCWKGGQGSTARKMPGGIVVGAVVVTNAIGNVFDPSTGITIAGSRRRPSRAAEFTEVTDAIPEYLSGKKRAGRATTIGVIVTNAELTHEQVIRIAQAGHDGLARVVRPVHAPTDGDTFFAVSTGEVRGRYGSNELLTLLGEVAAQEVSRSVLSAVRNARSLNGVPGLKM